MRITIIEETILIAELEDIAKEYYAPMIKGVVDIERAIVAFGGEYHIDANQKLIEHGSEQKNIWGFNVHLDRPRDRWIEYISLINIRPHANNLDMEVQDPEIRAQMKAIVDKAIR